MPGVHLSCMSFRKVGFMDLIDVTGISLADKAIVSLVGAGGKTSALFKMSEELKKRGLRVLVTTTTAIFYPEQEQYDHLFMWKSLDESGIPDFNIMQGSVTIIGSCRTENGKLKGIEPEKLDMLYDSKIFDFILVEADGSKRKPIKAPASHEPVIPSRTTFVIGIIGFDSYGKPLNHEWVHRPELLSVLCGKAMDKPIDDQVFIRLCRERNGLFKGSPSGAEQIVLINKVETQHEYNIAGDIGKYLINGNTGINKVIIGSILKQSEFITVRRS